MARHGADQPEDALESDLADDLTEDDTGSDDVSAERSAEVVDFWAKLQVDPIEVALPRGVGYTLRAYRMNDVVPSEDVADEVDELDELIAARGGDEEFDEELDEDEDFDEDEEEDEEEDEQSDATDEEDDEDEDESEPQEVPVFLTQDRKLLLFRSREGLVDFIRSGGSTTMQAVPEWDALRSEIKVDHVTVADEDRYELDLVVENLRGGHDAWEAELLIKAGEVCRDLGHALRLESVISALAPGSPLDDLDEALRDAESGRLTAFFARRRLRKIGAQQAALAWRSIIGKISTSVDWRD